MNKREMCIGLFFVVLALAFSIPSMEVSAAETQAVAMASETVSTGILGKNGRIQWSYDKSTKTLTITGEDSGLSLSPKSPFSDVETIIVRDCKPSGSLNSLFSGFKYLTTVRFENFDTSDVTDMRYMFYGCGSLAALDVSGWDTSKVTDMEAMFYGCSGLTTLDVSGFDTSNVEYMSYMFENCSNLTTLDVSGFDTAKVKRMDGMFENCSSLRMLDVSGFDTSNVTAMGMMFYNCNSLGTLDVSGFDTSNVTGMYCMFYGCNNLTALDVSGFKTSKVKNIFSMFSGCKRLMVIDVSGFDTSNVTDMSSMFYNCQNVLSLDVSNFDTSNVKNMNSMFFNCLKVANLDVSGFDTSKVTNMTYMFANCRNITSLDVSGFDTSNVKVMASVFDGCRKLTALDVSGFNTCGVTNMGGLFRDCNSLTALDVSGFDTSNVVYMNDMFSLCNSLKAVDVSGFDTSQVTTMRFMFYNCSSLTDLDAGGFDTAKVTDMGHMFNGCGKLAVLDISGFDMTGVDKLESVLDNCSALKLVYTPCVMGANHTIEMPITLINAKGEGISRITPDTCASLLTKEGEKQNIIILGNADEVIEEDSLQLRLQVDNAEKKIFINNYYSWSSSAPGVATVSADGLVTAVGEGVVTISCTHANGTSATYKITVHDKAGIATQPVSMRVTEGKNAVFKVTGEGYLLNYRWQVKTSSKGSWTDSAMTGAHTSAMTVRGTMARNGYQYRCVITDASGNTVISDAVTLAVVAKPVITSQPADISVDEGKDAVFSIIANGNGLKYQWQFKTSETASWKNSGMAGAKTASMTVQGTAERDGYQYRCIVTDTLGSQVTGDAVLLSVRITPGITKQPADRSVEEGNNAVFKVVARGNDIRYRWQVKTSEKNSWADSSVTGADTSCINVQGTMGRNGYQYRCIITDGRGNRVTSEAAALIVTEKTVINSQPVSCKVTEGDNAVFTVKATGYQLTYQWQFRTSSAGEWVDSGMTGAKTSSITVQGTKARNGYQYRCVITNGRGNKVTGNAASLTVTEKLAITGQPEGKTVVAGANATFKVTAKGTDLKYQWQFKTAEGATWTNSGMTGAKTSSITVQGTKARNGYQYRCVITDGNGNKVTSNGAMLTVN